MKTIKYFFSIMCMCGMLLAPACSDDGDDVVTPPDQTPERDGPMVLISAEGASFMMGSITGYADETPVHQAQFSRDFYMDSTEVTQDVYAAVMASAYPDFVAPTWAAPYGVGDRYPAYALEWGDAALYCNALSRRDGLDSVYAYTSISGTPGNGCTLEGLEMYPGRNGYRLPTEAEWEYACRAGNTTDFYWGKSISSYPSTAADSVEIGSYAVWAVNSWYLGAGETGFGTQVVAQRLPNAYGLYDMAGNVSEWCHDWYDESAYASATAQDPTGPSSGDWHSLRGGHWGSDAADLRSANRTFVVPDYLYYFIGFRTVRPVQ